MTSESLSFDVLARDRASGAFRDAGRSAADLGAKMDVAARNARVLDQALQKQQKAAQVSAGATIAAAKADKILADAEHVLRDGALEAEFALKKEAEAAKKSGDAAVKAAAENEGFAASMRKVADSAFLAPSGKGSLLALLPALIPVAGGLAGAVGLVGASFGAAAVAAGGFGIAAKSVLSGASQDAQKVQALQTKLATATTAAGKKVIQDQITAITQGWTPAYKTIVGDMEDLPHQWKAVAIQISASALVPWLDAVKNGLHFLVPLLKPVADEFQAWGQALDRYFKSSAGSSEITRIATAFGQFASLQLADIVSFIRDVGSGIHALGHDLSADGVYFGAFGDYLAKWGTGFATWSKSGQARADVQGFLAFMHQNGGLITGDLKDLGQILPGIFTGVSSTGQLELQAISGFLGFIAKLPKGWQQPLTEAAGALLLLSKTGVISTGLKVAYPKEGAGKGALAASLGMRLVAGAFIVPAAVMIIGTIIPKDTSKQAQTDFNNQPGIVVKISNFLHTEGLGAWVDQYFSQPIRKWVLTTLPNTLDTAASKLGVFLTKTIPEDTLRMVVSVTGILDKLPGPFQSAFQKAHDAAAGQLAKLQFNAAHTFGQIQSGINAFHGKKVSLTFGLNLPPGVSYPSRPIKGRAAGWRVPGSGSGDTVPAMLTPGEAVVPKRLVPAVAPFLSANRVPGFAGGGIAGPAFAGTFPSSGTIGADDAAMQAAVSSIAAAVKGLLHINKSAFSYPGSGSSGPGAAAAQAYAASILGLYGWGRSQMNSLIPLWNQESGWRWNALNASSGAYGIPQSLPASKMAAAGADWRTNPATQIRWGLGYIKTRPGYGSPAAAWAHEQAVGWYGNGLDAVFNKRTLIGVGERGPERVQVTPRGRSGTVVRHVFEIRAPHGATQLERAVAEMIRHVVDINGGDVQATLGSKA